MGGPGGYSIVNSSNTFADVLPGVSINALQADESKPITLKVTPDSAGQTAQVKAMVGAVNHAMSHISANPLSNDAANTGGPLAGATNRTSVVYGRRDSCRVERGGGRDIQKITPTNT